MLEHKSLNRPDVRIFHFFLTLLHVNYMNNQILTSQVISMKSQSILHYTDGHRSEALKDIEQSSMWAKVIKGCSLKIQKK